MGELPVRSIHVTAVSRVTPRMARITFGGDDLAGFGYEEPDQQVKLYFPRPGQAAPRMPAGGDDFMAWYQEFAAIPEPERPWMRSYTLRAHRPDRGEIDVDVVLHPDAGPATRWALSARPGDTLAMFGPSPLFARPVPLMTSVLAADRLLLAGDETALPAIGAVLERLPAGSRADVVVEVGDAAEEQRLDSGGEVSVRWLHRDGVPAGHGTGLLDAVRAIDLPADGTFAWIAAEAGAVRAVRRHLVGERGMDRRAVEFTGHWRLAMTQDDAPTEEDLAEARERLEAAG